MLFTREFVKTQKEIAAKAIPIPYEVFDYFSSAVKFYYAALCTIENMQAENAKLRTALESLRCDEVNAEGCAWLNGGPNAIIDEALKGGE